MKGKLMIMLLLIGSILFGAPAVQDPVVQNSKSFNINLTVNPVHSVKILKTVPTNVGDFNQATTITSHDFTESATTVDTYYLVVKTNNKSAVNIDVVVKSMKSAGINTRIAYTIRAGSTAIISDDTATTSTLFTEKISSAKKGMRIVSQPFKIVLNSSDVKAASSATYTSNIIFKLMAP